MLHWTIKHLLVPKARLILFGQWGSWKSMLAIHTTFCVSSGKPWIALPTTPSTTLLVQLEIPKVMFKERVLKYAKSHSLYPTNIWFITEPYLKLDTPQGMAKLDAIMSVIKPKLLILDPTYRVLSGDITSNWQVEKLITNIDILADRYDCAVILIAHTRKPVQDISVPLTTIGWGHELLGASYFQDWTDSAVAVELLPNDTLKLHFTKARLSEVILPTMTIKVDRSTLGWRII